MNSKKQNSKQKNNSNSNHGSAPQIQLDINGNMIDMTPQPLSTTNFPQADQLLGVDAVGGLKVGTDDGISAGVGSAPLATISTGEAEAERKTRAGALVEAKVAAATAALAENENENEDEGEDHHTKHTSSKSKKHDHKEDKKVPEKKKSWVNVTQEEVKITLTETKTIFLLNIQGTAVPNDFPGYKEIVGRNDKYANVLAGEMS